MVKIGEISSILVYFRAAICPRTLRIDIFSHALLNPFEKRQLKTIKKLYVGVNIINFGFYPFFFTLKTIFPVKGINGEFYVRFCLGLKVTFA